MALTSIIHRTPFEYSNAPLKLVAKIVNGGYGWAVLRIDQANILGKRCWFISCRTDKREAA